MNQISLTFVPFGKGDRIVYNRAVFFDFEQMKPRSAEYLEVLV
jgi:hypothetical protein